MIELNKLKYAELQKLAKAAGIKANKKHDVLVAELSKHYQKQENKNKNKPQKKQTNKTPNLNSPLVGSPKSTPKQVSKQNGKKSPSVSNAAPAPKTNSVITPKATAFTIPVERKSTPSGPKTQSSTNGRTPNSPRHTPILSRWEKKVFTPTGSGSRQSAGKTNTPTLHKDSGKRKATDHVSTPEPQPKKRRSTFEKAPTPNLKTPEVVATPPERRRSSRSGTSPGVKEMLGAMKSDMNSQEMKDSLMSVIDKKVQVKCKVEEASSSNATSNIPRFAAFLKKRQESKPITPGNKDWDKIHKKNFEKFDSIDTYLQKKRKRAEEIATSIKKAKTITEEVNSAMKKLKSHKTPEVVETKFKKPRVSNPNKTSPFKPMVFNTKNMSFNFTAKKSPKTLPRKSPQTVLGNDRKENKTSTAARKSTGTNVLPRKSMTTPFKFTGGNTLNTTVTSTKKTFNLQASLSKPLPYKPHTGKLKPLEPTGPVCPTYKTKFVSATKATKNRENMKSSITQRRADKKMNSVMSRRGIKM